MTCPERDGADAPLSVRAFSTALLPGELLERYLELQFSCQDPSGVNARIRSLVRAQSPDSMIRKFSLILSYNACHSKCSSSSVLGVSSIDSDDVVVDLGGGDLG